jgi:hypothetical protein
MSRLVSLGAPVMTSLRSGPVRASSLGAVLLCVCVCVCVETDCSTGLTVGQLAGLQLHTNYTNRHTTANHCTVGQIQRQLAKIQILRLQQYAEKSL